METHVKVIGWLHIVLSALLLVVAGFVFLAVFGGGLISGDRTAFVVTLLVSVCVSGLLFVLAVPGLFAGVGLLQFKPWARILALVLAVFNLLNFPLGTLLGIYTFIVLLTNEGERLFNPVPAMAGSAVAAPTVVAAPVVLAPPPAPTPAVTTVLEPEPPVEDSPASSEPIPPAL
jgi:hypothetical protein